MYSFLRRPLWIVSHVLIAALIVVLISLGFWQRARYFEERGLKDELQAAAKAEPVPLSDVIDPAEAIGAVDESVTNKRVVVKGTFDTTSEVFINNRSFDGSPGAWIVTPLLVDGGPGVIVVRGWVPLAVADAGLPPIDGEAPAGEVSVSGLVQRTQVRGSLGPIDPPDGRLDKLARVDLKRLGKQLPYPIAPVWVLADTVDPAPVGDYPAIVSLQPNDPSQNLSYMFQWWIFASIAVIGYPLVLRMVARTKAAGGPRRRRGPIDDEIPWAEGLGPNASGLPVDGPDRGDVTSGGASATDSSAADKGTVTTK